MKISFSKKRGFSMLEFLLYLGALMAFATIVLPVGSDMYRSGRYNATKTNVSAIAMAVQQYKFEIESYPASLNSLTAKVGQYGPWMDEDTLKDPWNNDYVYIYDETNNKFAVWSMGENGTNNSGDNPSSFSEDDIGIISH